MHVDSAIAAVEAHVVDILVIHGRVVDVVHLGDVHIQHRAVVKKVPAVPASAFKSQTEIAKPVIDPAIETYVWAPVTLVENKPLTAPSPPARSPQEPDLGSKYPRSRNPVVIAKVVVVSPVSWSPEIAVAGTNRLVINRNRRRTKHDGHADLCEHRRRWA